MSGWPSKSGGATASWGANKKEEPKKEESSSSSSSSSKPNSFGGASTTTPAASSSWGSSSSSSSSSGTAAAGFGGSGFGAKKTSEEVSKTATTASKPNNSDDDYNPEEEVPTSTGGEAKFAAVESKSGEEAYNQLCCVKVKLMRFDEGENQWKQRGEGEIKVLEQKANKNVHTILCRREVIGKIACQHALAPGMALKPHPKSDKVFTWATACDLSDDPEGIPETFLGNFPTTEAAQQFKSVFNSIAGEK